MFKSKIDKILKDINSIYIDIQNKKKSISDLEKINLEKSNRNYRKYLERINQLDKTENSIKMLMENKYFKYIQHIDFLDDKYIESLDGFELNKNLGCIIRKKENMVEVPYINKIISSNKKQIIYSYSKDGIISNMLEYSFYNLKNGIPIIPTSIKVKYKDEEDNFFEPYFRFYNRNNTTSFINSFPFIPKQISQITFDFDEEINTNNCFCKLYSINYSVNDENKILLKFNNVNNIKTFNISKKTEESIVQFKFYYSENNMDFKELKFENQQDDIVSLDKSSAFYLKIVPDNKQIKLKEETAVKTVELFSKDLDSNFGVYKLPSSISNLKTIKIIFPLSSYNLIKSDMEKIGSINIDDYLQKDNSGLYCIKSDFIQYISSVNEEVNNLKYIDDISILKENKKFFNVYVNSNEKKIYFPNFINYNFFIETQFSTVLEKIDETYYTPFLFSISLKG